MDYSEPLLVAASWLTRIFALYVLLGIFFAVAFLARGVERLDPNARGTGLGFRLLILPGSVAFWPLLLTRWLKRSPPPVERNQHRDAARRSS
jgi:hypothetical protein